MITIVCIIPTTASNSIYSSLRRCVSSLKRAGTRDVRIETLIVTPNKKPALRSLRKKISNMVYADNSYGFSQMNNLALAFSFSHYSSAYHLFINDDAWIDDRFFSKICNIIQKDDADIIVPLIRSPSKKIIDSFGIEYFTSGFPRNSDSVQIKTTLASAACVLVKTSLLRKMKKTFGYVFHPLLFYYIEDVEFSIRALSMNAKIYKYELMKAYHVGSQTSKKEGYFIYYQSFRNILWVIILTWPLHIIAKHLFQIILVFFWLLWTTRFINKPLACVRIVTDTLLHARELQGYRTRTLNKYPHKFNFERIFTPYMFRTRKKGILI